MAGAAGSADDASVVGGRSSTEQPFIDRWDGTRWRSVPLDPAGRVRRPGSVGLTVTSDGSVAVLAAEGMTDGVNLLWLRCQH